MSEPFVVPRVKVCGLSTHEDVACAVAAGCEAIGLVEYPLSSRAVTARRAEELCATLPDRVLSVAVFVDRSPGEVEHFLAASGARAAQLCGGERADQWRSFPVPILRRIAVGTSAEREFDLWRDVASCFVLDHPSAAGGSGRAVDSALAVRLAQLAPCLLAGGLSADNVASSIVAVRPAGVDASSRLESSPGVKDPERVRAFVVAALAALEELAP
jgi:phosphoribosylanthranilate isomerase